MKALRFERFGDSDVKNVAGAFHDTTLPRTPGRDFAGTIDGGPRSGERVWGTAGEVGFTRDGAHAEYVVVPDAAATLRPRLLGADAAASVGVTFVTAWSTVVDTLAVDRGEWLVVTGSSGAVGAAAVQLGHMRGARVVGLDLHPPAEGPAPDIFVDSRAPDLREVVLRATDGGAHALHDAVSGSSFERHLSLLRHGGRIAVISSVDRARVEFDMRDFFHQALRLTGVDSRALDAATSGAILSRLAAAFASGTLKPPRVANRFPLADAVQAYQAVARGTGKTVLVP
jgi:NADPH:quinone reductase-like Zn-dependent oxidoreductase